MLNLQTYISGGGGYRLYSNILFVFRPVFFFVVSSFLARPSRVCPRVRLSSLYDVCVCVCVHIALPGRDSRRLTHFTFVLTCICLGRPREQLDAAKNNNKTAAERNYIIYRSAAHIMVNRIKKKKKIAQLERDTAAEYRRRRRQRYRLLLQPARPRSKKKSTLHALPNNSWFV